jgi:hypothetical protein
MVIIKKLYYDARPNKYQDSDIPSETWPSFPPTENILMKSYMIAVLTSKIHRHHEKEVV